MPPSPEPVNPTAARFAAPPDPGEAGTLDNLVERLRQLKIWAGDPSYERITERINASWSAAGRPAGELARKNTVADCFKTGRRRINADLVVSVVQALHPDVGYVAQWRQALQVIGGEAHAAAQVRVQGTLPPDLSEFTGRTVELDQLRQAILPARRDGGAVAIAAIEGMAGVGKTRLAVHVAHLLVRDDAVDRVLFVNLRGFHPDSTQPPADPAAVLDGFLRLLGVPGQQMPHDLSTRAAVYRGRLAGTRTLVVLDDAANAEQVRPLLPGTPGCFTLVTSRRDLTDVNLAVHLTVDVFTPDEAVAYLARAVPDVPVGADPFARSRIARRCGYLPLALGLVAGHIRATQGWTLTDHADRLDERHQQRHLDAGVKLAFQVSYQHLPRAQQRLLRLAALHPGQDFDAHAAAALTDTDLATVRDHLHHLCRDHLVQQAALGRYSLHDLVRAYASDRAVDEERPPERRAALTRLFDQYLATAATAMDLAYPHERLRRPTIPPAGASALDLPEQKPADQWLETELTNLLASAEYAADMGWPEHTCQLSATLDRHLSTRGHYARAATLHQQALRLARELGNRLAEMNALNSLGQVDRMLSRYERAGDHHQKALQVARDIGDRIGEVNALNGLGSIHWMLGRSDLAGDYLGSALHVAQEIGDHVGEVVALNGLGSVRRMLGDHEQAIGHHGRALQIAHDIDDRIGELNALHGLGDMDLTLGRYEQAGDHLERALQIAHDIGDRIGELYALSGLGNLHWLLGRHDRAADYFERALQIARDIGNRTGELGALNGLGDIHRTVGRHSEAVDCYQHVFDLASELGDSNWQFEALQGLGRLHSTTGHPDRAVAHHEQALQLATDLAQPADQARAHDGLAHAHHALRHHQQARWHWQQALDILTRLGTDHTDEIQASVPNIRAKLQELTGQGLD